MEIKTRKKKENRMDCDTHVSLVEQLFWIIIKKFIFIKYNFLDFTSKMCQ
jgi:hypothetical protein